MHPNVKAFLDTIALSELGPDLLVASDNGYNVIVGSTARNPHLFNSYADHPRQMVKLIVRGQQLTSSAAGRYQVLMRYYDSYKRSLALPNFGPDAQDAIAVQMIMECHALELIIAGKFEAAINICASRWASFPGAGYNQNEHRLSYLQAAYIAAGGVVA